MIPALQFDNWQWLALQLATPVVIWGAWPFHRAAWANLQHAHGDDGHADQRRHAHRLAVVAVRAVHRRRRRDRDADAVRPLARPSAGSDHIYLEVAAVVTIFILAGPLLRGARQAPRGRRAGGAARARREGRRDPRRRRRRAPRAGRAARRRRPLRRAPGREGRDRRVVEEGTSAVDQSLLTGESCRSRSSRATRSPARPSTRAAGSSSARRRSAPTPRWRRSPGS